MVQFSSVLVLALAAISTSVSAAPLTKRIAQVIAESTAQWEKACLAAGGADKCNPVSVAAFTTLLAAAGDCDQQNAGDKMIDLAKTLKNDPNMIKFAQLFVQQARNTPNSVSVPYCQQAPKNAELNGLFQCQFKGANPTTFVGGVKVGAPGTVPLGLNAPLSPPGSCKANPGGPIADGTQLTSVTQNPGVGAGGGAAPAADAGDNADPAGTDDNTGAGDNTGAEDPAGTDDNTGAGDNTSAEDPAGTDDNTGAGDNTGAADPTGAEGPTGAADPTGAEDPTATPPAAATPPVKGASAGADAGAGGFKLQNGKDAKALNDKFTQLSASSSCNEGDQACVDNGFAQCVGGKFVSTPCGATLICSALPLVNKPGTTIACTTQSDADARFAAAGV